MLDLDVYHPHPPMRVYAPKSRINIRPVSLLHPQDVIIYTALTLIIRDAVEASRIPKSKKRVFSYRSKPTAPAQLYQAEDAYQRFTQRLSEKATSARYVAVTDIADFYPRLYQHRLENVIRTISPTGSRSADVARVLVEKFIGHVAGANSYGIPVGPPASRVLGEALLIDVDEALLSEKMDFVRFVDDYAFFCSTQAEAQRCLLFLGEWLFEKHGLTLQPLKTQILTASRFIQRINVTFEQRLKRRSEALKKLFEALHEEDPYASPGPFVPGEQTLALIEGTPLVELLNKAVEDRETVDYELVDFILRRVGTIGTLDSDIKRDLIRVVLKNLSALYPVSESIARFFLSIPNLRAGERQQIAKVLLRPLVDGKTRLPDYYAMWTLHLFASAPEWGQAPLIRRIYTKSRSDVVRRYAALALACVGNRSHTLAVTPDINGAVPMLKTAILFCSRKLGADERKHWRKANMSSLTGFVEKAI